MGKANKINVLDKDTTALAATLQINDQIIAEHDSCWLIVTPSVTACRQLNRWLGGDNKKMNRA